MQSYEHIALQYYYMGMMDKATQYNKTMEKGAIDESERPKGFESVKARKIPGGGVGTDLEEEPISRRMTEIKKELYDGSTKILVQQDKDYGTAKVMKTLSGNFSQRI